jgi:sugar/nucleoside kinase (ribokinase family)
MRIYGGLCGWVLARAHARAGDRFAIAAYLGGDDAFDDALLEFAERYADRTERDHASLADAAQRGSIPVESGV